MTLDPHEEKELQALEKKLRVRLAVFGRPGCSKSKHARTNLETIQARIRELFSKR